MEKITHFSASTLDVLKKDNRRKFYVYCLVDPRNGIPFYIGKGTGNRVFHHEQLALKNSLEKIDDELFSGEIINNLKFDNIMEIKNSGNEIIKYIISFGLTDSESFAAENALINYSNLVQKNNLTNLVGGHGSFGYLVESIEERFGYQRMDESDINTNDLILAVKIRNGFDLIKDENLDYAIGERDDNNLKSRTLGEWIIGADKIEQIKYIIGINTGADNAVISAYEVSYKESGSKPSKGGRTRYSFKALSNNEETLKKLGLYKKSLPNLTFGSGASTVYVRNFNKVKSIDSVNL